MHLSRRVSVVMLCLYVMARPVRLVAQTSAERPPALEAPRIGLYDTVARVLTRTWPPTQLRGSEVADQIRLARPAADSARTFGDELRVVNSLLRTLPASHLGLTSASAAGALTAALRGVRAPTLGMQLLEWQGRWYATTVLDGGPARRAGVRDWDEILSINGTTPERSPLVDYRNDDAYLDDDRDPPVHPFVVSPGDTVRLALRAEPDSTLTLDVAVAPYSAWDGTQASLEVIEVDSVRVGIVHLWYMHTRAVAGWLSNRFDDEWRNVGAILLDLRGRGGDGALATRIDNLLSGEPGRARFRGPVVALQDRMTRSAKEVLLDMLQRRGSARLVGEPSAGAVLGSAETMLGHGLALLHPVSIVDGAAGRLEGRPVTPDVHVAWGGPLSGGRDPIFDAGLQEVTRLVAAFGKGTVLPAIHNEDLRKTRGLRP